MSHMTLSDYEYSKRKKKTKREEFLDVMEEIIPWDEWVEFVRPYYPNGKRGRPTKGIEKMLRMYLLQVWFNLSDEGIEDAIYDSYAFKKFMSIDFNEEQVPDATTLLTSSGKETSGKGDVQGCQLCPRTKWSNDERRYDCRCYNHQCPEFDKESEESQRSRNAPDKERQ